MFDSQFLCQGTLPARLKHFQKSTSTVDACEGLFSFYYYKSLDLFCINEGAGNVPLIVELFCEVELCNDYNAVFYKIIIFHYVLSLT